MGILFTYDTSHLTTVRDRTPRLQESAESGAVGQGEVVIEDSAGTLAITGHKGVRVTESSCSTQTTFRGYVAARTYKRGDAAEKTGTARWISLNTVDLNARLGFKVIRGIAWKRPAETISARLTALLASSFLSGLVADNGFVSYPTTNLDATDLRGMRPGDVLSDMAERVGYNFFVYWDESANSAGLWFADSNTSTNWTSTLRISSVSTDVDTSTTFAAGGDTELSRDPARVVSGVWMPFRKGNVYRTRAATETMFQARDGTAPNANVSRRAKAQAIADTFLFTHRNEEDRVTTTLQLPAAKVNLVRAGMRIQAKFAEFTQEGYGAGFTYWRVLSRTVSPLVADAGEYAVQLVLSPQEGGCSVQPTFVQYKWQETVAQLSQPNWTWRASLDAASTPGNLILMAFIGDDLNTGTLAAVPSGWTAVLNNYNMKADQTGDWCHLLYKKSVGESYVDLLMTGSARGPRVMFMEYAGLTNPVQSGTENKLRQVGLGYADVTNTSYPSGPSAVLSVCYMHTGPESGDHLTATGTNHSLRTPQDSAAPGYFGSPVIGVGDYLRTGSSGATSSWQFGFTNDEETLTVGIVFVGDNC